MIQHKELNWWVNKIKNNEYFSLARFGDGEFLCVQGRKGANSHGCRYTPELRADLEYLLADDYSPNLYKGMQRILPKQLREVRPLLKGQWFDTELFGDSMAEGKFGSFFHALKSKRVVVISSAEKRKVMNILPFFYNKFIEAPKTNTHEMKSDIVKEILADGLPGIYLFACGMAAGPIVHALHNKIKRSWLIDIGHVFDPFIGDNSREYLKHVPNEILMQNLNDPTQQ